MRRYYPTLADVRNFWDRRPCNVRHGGGIDINLDPVGYSLAVTAQKYLVEPHIGPFSEFERWAGKRVLDAGCGIGTQTISFAQAGAHVTAVDVSEKSIEIARKRVDALGLSDRVHFMALPLEELARYLPWEEPFDLVYSFGVLHHTPHPGVALHNLRRYMDERSEMKLMLYHRVSWKVLWILLQQWDWLKVLGGTRLDWIVARRSEAQGGSPVTRTYTKKQARSYLVDHGLTASEMRSTHIFPFQIPAYIEGQFLKTWYWQRVPPRVFHWLERHFGWHLLIDAVVDLDAKPVGIMERETLRIG